MQRNTHRNNEKTTHAPRPARNSRGQSQRNQRPAYRAGPAPLPPNIASSFQEQVSFWACPAGEARRLRKELTRQLWDITQHLHTAAAMGGGGSTYDLGAMGSFGEAFRASLIIELKNWATMNRNPDVVRDTCGDAYLGAPYHAK